MKKSFIFLAPSKIGLEIELLSKTIINSSTHICVNNLSDLRLAFEKNHFKYLVSFGSSVIVPNEILEIPDLISLNIHSSSPNSPGRDPHHFASYADSDRYGATIHFMTNKVDSGPIIDVKIFSVNKKNPEEFLRIGNKAGFALIQTLFKMIQLDKPILPNPDLIWYGKKTSRQDFLDHCELNFEMDEREIKRRFYSFSWKNKTNLFINIEGKKVYFSNIHEFYSLKTQMEIVNQ